LRHISRFRDRHGHLRHYLRIPGRSAVALPGAPGSPEFIAAYNEAVEAAAKPGPAEPPRVAPGTLDALAVSYYRSAQFLALRASTALDYKRQVEELRGKHGSNPLSRLNEKAVRHLLSEKTRYAYNHRLRMLRLLIAHAIDQGWMTTDPTQGIKQTRLKTIGYPTWSEEHIAAYEAKHPAGSRARLALYLLLYTGQRRSDVVRMGRQSLTDIQREDGSRIPAIWVRQVKTETELKIPLHPILAEELARIPAGQMLFLQTEERGRTKGFTSGGFYNLFVTWARDADIPPGLAPHGLRKACCRRMAEAGATTHQIAAVTGHRNLREVETYTRAAEQARMAAQGMERIGGEVFQPFHEKLPTRRKIGG
jgi:integrase